MGSGGLGLAGVGTVKRWGLGAFGGWKGDNKLEMLLMELVFLTSIKEVIFFTSEHENRTKHIFRIMFLGF